MTTMTIDDHYTTLLNNVIILQGPLAEDVSTVFTSEDFFTMLFSIAK